MDAQRRTIAENCMRASYEATMDFPDIISTLVGAGFEGYHVDYRSGTTAYYHGEGDSIVVDNIKTEGAVGTRFLPSAVEANVRQAQAHADGYSYRGFCENVKAAGCAGYLVSFSGRRVVYYGRNGECHIEHFPK
ncbi:DUF1398 family protein [Rhizobium sp. S152]|uniref:DUF1398 family protein n=1 Tax=Rhizobium sp. S152 TaxID=3055038 RepID=UPI0025A95B63|nr:DUF1398 family protein [Rhizobium sp. S152]MDM9628146.1 DUF1398 family protein [Rhizobium sp. S152]